MGSLHRSDWDDDEVRNRILATVNGAPGGTTAGLTLEATGGSAAGFRLGPPNPKQPIRFAVGVPGERSTVWRLWANRNKSDVYLASRLIARIFKVSFHESGDWRHQWISDDHGDVSFIPPDDESLPPGRVIHQWRRPPRNSVGWTDAFSIYVPSEDVTEVPGDPEQAMATQWVAKPVPGEITKFRIFFVEPRKGSVDLTPALHGGEGSMSFMNGFRLANGEVVLLFASTGPLDPELEEELERHRRQNRLNIDPSFDLSPETGPRSMVWEQHSDGRFGIWDLSLG